MTDGKIVVPANSVPAAAVIRGGQALFVMIGRIADSDTLFFRGATQRGIFPCVGTCGKVWREWKVGGISGGEVKFNEIRRNAKGEDNLLSIS